MHLQFDLEYEVLKSIATLTQWLIVEKETSETQVLNTSYCIVGGEAYLQYCAY